jgi:tyrosyl-tRNA synthetase
MGLFSRTVRVDTDEAKINSLLTRGVENVIPKELALKKLRSGEQLRVYLGIDPTGAKLHLGHSVALRKLQQFADLGHHVIFLVGSFTAMIGDPSGRDAMRAPLTRAQVEENFKDYKRQAKKVLDFSQVEIRYNHEWLEKLGFEEIVKLASNFTVQQMLQRDMYEKRLKEGKPIALHEFLYPVMVGYDSVVLDVDVELGGSDQEFNILAGRHLQQALGKRDKFVLTTKLIEGLDGRKMSKTYNNCIYLDDAPSDMYGKVMSAKDELLPTYFETATQIPMHEVHKILAGHPKEAKMRLLVRSSHSITGPKRPKKQKRTFVILLAKARYQPISPKYK